MSDAIPILHMITPLKHMSPFDVNMAADAGFKVIVPYTNVTTEEVTALVQDAIFSRPPADGARTGFFIAGKDIGQALDMLGTAKAAMVPPFKISVLADPAGSFTTAAAMVACVERTLRDKFKRDLKGARVAVFGATGVVGFASAVLSALEGAEVTVAARGLERAQGVATGAKERFGAEVRAADATSSEQRLAIVRDAEVVCCAAAAGVQVLSGAHLAAGRSLLVAADVNAVPPTGVEGMEMFADGVPLGGLSVLGVGPLTIGNVKYGTESGLFKRMIASSEALALDFRDAFALARTLAR